MTFPKFFTTKSPEYSFEELKGLFMKGENLICLSFLKSRGVDVSDIEPQLILDEKRNEEVNTRGINYDPGEYAKMCDEIWGIGRAGLRNSPAGQLAIRIREYFSNQKEDRT